MSARYTRLGQLEGKFRVLSREYLTARDLGRNFTFTYQNKGAFLARNQCFRGIFKF